MRALLLTEICRRMDIIDYCIRWLYIHLDPGLRDTWTAAYCPYCGKKDVFHLDKNTGKYFCISCGKEGDFLGLMSDKKRNDLTGTLFNLTGYLQQADASRKPYIEGITTEGGITSQGGVV